jgi:1-acyl-sn-glycerol-3-phosphate acyltransferase
MIPARDRRAIFNPLWLATRLARFAFHRLAGEPSEAERETSRDPELVALLLDLVDLAGRRYFRYSSEGIEHVPSSGPALFVGNHSGGLFPTDALFLASDLRRHFGAERSLHVLAHDFVFDDPTLARYARRIGLVRASHQDAERVLGLGGCLLVYPGSDRDAFRPFADRHRLVLAGRKGFLRLAAKSKAPVLPVVSVGTHEQLVVLFRGDQLARLFRARAWARTDVFPIVWSLPWGITTGFLPYWPLPARIMLRVGAPMPWAEVRGEAASDPTVLERRYLEIESAMQRMLDELVAARCAARSAERSN